MASSVKWLPVIGYEGLYEVSDAGQVRSQAGPTMTRIIPMETGVYNDAWYVRADGAGIDAVRGDEIDTGLDWLRLAPVAQYKGGPEPTGAAAVIRDGAGELRVRWLGQQDVPYWRCLNSNVTTERWAYVPKPVTVLFDGVPE